MPLVQSEGDIKVNTVRITGTRTICKQVIAERRREKVEPQTHTEGKPEGLLL